MTPEHDIQNAILRAIGTKPSMRIWRSNTGVARAGRRMVQFGVNGQADLTGILPIAYQLTCQCCGAQSLGPTLGVRLEIEVKAPRGTQSDDQINYERMIRNNSGIYILARSVDDVVAGLKSYGYTL